MAMKVKKKDESKAPSDDELVGEVEDSEEDGDVKVVVPESGYKLKKGNWAEENPQAVIGLIVGIAVAILGVYYGFQYMESQKVAKSAEMTPAFKTYNMMVKGSLEYEELSKMPNIDPPEETLESEEARWTKIYETSNATLASAGDAEIAQTARLTKAAAAYRLGKFDEAISTYQEALKAAKDPVAKAPIYQGLATAQAAGGKVEEALKSYDELAGLNDKFKKSTQYPRAVLLESSGKKDEAKKIYHDILESDPMHPQKSDIERRLATL